ncbi:MAG: transposase [Candidatus Omnitrophica bacterium]|nr:transposase [Candidatus Omnitrophota bacterium]
MPRQGLLQVARLAYRLAAHILPAYSSKFAPKKFTQPSLLACLCLKEYLKLDYRGLEALLASAAELRAALGLRTVPDHSTFHWFARYQVKPRLLVQVLEAAARLFPRRKNGRHIVAVDATGFSRRPASRYDNLRQGTWSHSYLLWSTLVWTQPRVICAQAARMGPGSQSQRLPPLVEQGQHILPVHRLLADADYDSEPHHRWLRETCHIESIIPATRGRPGRARGIWRRRMQTHFPRRPYGQRWLAETVFSVVKRKFGEALTARRPWQQVKQAFLRGITYNLYRAVQLGLVLWRWLWHRVLLAFAS